jgi:DNA-binding NtrC family response regulator
MNNVVEQMGVGRQLLRVLLVEDDDVDAKVVSIFAAMSATYNFELTHVSSIETAMQALNATSFDICLLDFWVGQQTSMRLLTSLEKPGSKVATVVLSNISNRDAEVYRIPNGGATFLAKGNCSAKNLEIAVTTALGRLH